MKCRSKSSFTLIELLVVIAIIGILAGMIFKMMAYATRDALTAQTIGILEQIGHALEEYRAEYGEYPPVDFVYYEYEDTNYHTAYFDSYLDVNPDFDPGYKYGLVAHLWPRWRDTIKHTTLGAYIEDEPRDETAKERWAPFLQGIEPQVPSKDLGDLGRYPDFVLPTEDGGSAPYTNGVVSILDGWERQIHYQCYPPYLTYRMWSNGPDTTDGTADDIHKDKWD